MGATEAITGTLAVLLEDDDLVLIPTPTYPIYPEAVTMLNHDYVLMDTALSEFKVTPENLEKAIIKNQNKIKVLILNNPCNPTGIVYMKFELTNIVNVCKKYNVWILADEIYSSLSFIEKVTPIVNLYPEGTVTVNGVSKSHAMTGWRIGFCIGPAQFMSQFKKVHQYMVTTADTIAQLAAKEALLYGQSDSNKMMQEYQFRGNYLCD